jgi:hydroxyacyl-ACP dehydratase HTD2-like protein with hotdog domain
MAHLAFFWDPVEPTGLGFDGHPTLGGLIPDLGLPLRMWAGGRLVWHAPFRAGVAAERVSRVTSVTRKQGRTGELGFVTLRHEVRQAGAPVLSEDQDLVYRPAGSGAGEPPVETEEADERRALKLNEISLFRYSAVTFNAHRIHYDAGFCAAEGFQGVVVHGPLMATHLAMFAEEVLGGLARFSFRATAPLILGDVAWLCRKDQRFWVEGPRRRICMEAEAQG